jgi:serine/threonine protein kinase
MSWWICHLIQHVQHRATQLITKYAFDIVLVTDEESREDWKFLNYIRAWDCGPRHATIEIWQNQNTQEKCVWKSCEPDGQAFNELELVSLLDKHPNVCSITHIVLSQDNFNVDFIGMPLFCQWNLSKFLLYKKEMFTFEVSMRVFRQILHGLQFLHNRRIIHHDLCPENIFVTDENLGHVAVGDLGIAVVDLGKNPIPNYDYQGRANYRAPEPVLTTNSDIFALFSLTRQLFFANAIPCSDVSELEPDIVKFFQETPAALKHYRVNKGDAIRMVIGQLLRHPPNWIVELIDSFENEDPSKRPTCQEILKILEVHE